MKDFITANSGIVWHLPVLTLHLYSSEAFQFLSHNTGAWPHSNGNILIHSTQDSVGTVCIKRHCGHTLTNLQMISTFFIVCIHMEPPLAPFAISVHWQWLHLLAPATQSTMAHWAGQFILYGVYSQCQHVLGGLSLVQMQ